MRSNEIRQWAGRILEQINQICSIDETEFTFLAGDKYRKYSLLHIKNSKILLEGLRIGEQLQKLKGVGRMSDECEVAYFCQSVHQMVNELERHHSPFEESKILNGIYILFQKGENGHQQERIVRIGRNKVENRLPLRSRQHFSKENKDSSIFRKNIGRALLHQKNDPFLKCWDITRKAKEEHASLIDYDYQKKIEGLVSQCI